MSLKIRLARGGAKKRPFYRIVVADSRAPRDGRFIEKLGYHNPMVNKADPKRVVLNEDRVKYWLGIGAKPTDRVARFLASAGLAGPRAIPVQTLKNLPGEKAKKRQLDKAEKAKSAAQDDASKAPEATTYSGPKLVAETTPDSIPEAKTDASDTTKTEA